MVDLLKADAILTIFARVKRAADRWPVQLFVCLIFTLVMIYHYVIPLNAILYTRGITGTDCAQMIWNLWHTNEAITAGHNPYHTDLAYYPEGANLAHHTLAAGFFPITFVVKKLSRDDPMYPVYAYRLIVLLSFTLLLYFSYLLLRELGQTRWASATAAVAYSFSDFYVLHALHINHLAGFFIPLTALCLVRFYRQPTTARSIVLALVSSGAIYFTEFTLYIYMAAALFFIGLCLNSDDRARIMSWLRQAGGGRIVLTGATWLLLISPFVTNLLRDKVVNPPPAASHIWSSNLAGFIIPDPQRTHLYGSIFAALNSHVTKGIGGFENFLGIPVLVFAAVALVKARNRFVGICTALALVFLALSLGPTLKVLGTETGIPMPYSLLMRVPPFDYGRTPVRFVVMGLFFLMILAAMGISWTETVVARQRFRRFGPLLMTLLFIWAAAEVYQPIPRQQPFAPPADLAKLAPGPVIELPPLAYDGYAALLQVFHHQPTATGGLVRNSGQQWQRFRQLQVLFDRGGSQFCDEIEKLGFRNIIITPNEYLEPNEPGGMAPLALSRCPLPIVDLRQRDAVVPGYPSLLIKEGTEEPGVFPLWPSGTRIRFSTTEAGKYLWYGWSGREALSRWTNRGTAAIIFSADQAQIHDPAISVHLLVAPFLAPGKLEAQHVKVKLNDHLVAEWVATTVGPELHRIEIPAGLLQQRNVLSFSLPDATSPKALGVNEDVRLLGINVQWMELDTAGREDRRRRQ